jgi:histidine triad (HIT) family protein
MKDCIFCKIIKKEIPAYVLYEDDNFIVFLDANPDEKGHCLIVPKQEAQDMFELREELLTQVLLIAKKVALAIKKTYSPASFKIVQNNGSEAGQVVMHYHMHIIPKYKTEGHKGKNDFEHIASEIKKNL